MCKRLWAGNVRKVGYCYEHRRDDDYSQEYQLGASEGESCAKRLLTGEVKNVDHCLEKRRGNGSRRESQLGASETESQAGDKSERIWEFSVNREKVRKKYRVSQHYGMNDVEEITGS